MHPSAVFAGLLALVATGVKAIAVERAIFPPAATPFHLVPFFTNVPALLATCLDNSGNIALNGPSCGNFTLGNPLIGPSIPFASLQTKVGPCSVVAAPNAEGEVVSPLVCSAGNEGGRFVQGQTDEGTVLELWATPANDETPIWSSDSVTSGQVFGDATHLAQLVLRIVDI